METGRPGRKQLRRSFPKRSTHQQTSWERRQGTEQALPNTASAASSAPEPGESAAGAAPQLCVSTAGPVPEPGLYRKSAELLHYRDSTDQERNTAGQRLAATAEGAGGEDAGTAGARAGAEDHSKVADTDIEEPSESCCRRTRHQPKRRRHQCVCSRTNDVNVLDPFGIHRCICECADGGGTNTRNLFESISIKMVKTIFAMPGHY